MKKQFMLVLLAVSSLSAQASSRLEQTWLVGKQSIQFEAGKVSGFAGCNNFSGTYTLSGVKIAFSGFATTRKACEKNLMDEETAFLRDLSSAKTYSISLDGKRLTLLGNVVMRLSKK